MLSVDSSWWTGARLIMGDAARDGRLVELGSGPLTEMVSLALSRPDSERPRLRIEIELGGGALDWAGIAALAAHAGRPVII